MERESKQVDRREVEKRRDDLVRRALEQRKFRDSIRSMLAKSVAEFPSHLAKHEALWILSTLDNRIARLEGEAARAESVAAMLKEEAKREGIDVLKFTW